MAQRSRLMTLDTSAEGGVVSVKDMTNRFGSFGEGGESGSSSVSKPKAAPSKRSGSMSRGARAEKLLEGELDVVMPGAKSTKPKSYYVILNGVPETPGKGVLELYGKTGTIRKKFNVSKSLPEFSLKLDENCISVSETQGTGKDSERITVQLMHAKKGPYSFTSSDNSVDMVEWSIYLSSQVVKQKPGTSPSKSETQPSASPAPTPSPSPKSNASTPETASPAPRSVASQPVPVATNSASVKTPAATSGSTPSPGARPTPSTRARPQQVPREPVKATVVPPVRVASAEADVARMRGLMQQILDVVNTPGGSHSGDAATIAGIVKNPEDASAIRSLTTFVRNLEPIDAVLLRMMLLRHLPSGDAAIAVRNALGSQM